MSPTSTSTATTNMQPALAWFQAQGDSVYSSKDLQELVGANRGEWRLRVGVRRLTEFLEDKGALRHVQLASVNSKYPPISRYVHGSPTPFMMALSIWHGFLSHASALYVHALSDQIPTTVYVNKEQSEKPEPSGRLTQTGIDRAFKAEQRRTSYVFLYENHQLALLSGKHTGELEVQLLTEGPFSGVRVTSLERTLIDITVRPEYAGGVAQVAQAFARARGRISATRLVSTLDALSYRYPYHQPLGFYLERANYPKSFLAPLRARKVQHNFYLAHAMDDAELDSSWRVYHPKWLKLSDLG